MLRKKIVNNIRRHSLILKTLKKCEKNPETIVMINGGISSQMQQYIIGYYLKLRGENVTYDLSYYNIYDGKGALTRNFDLLKLFPNLDFKIADEKKVSKYKKLYKYIPNSYNIKASEWGKIDGIPHSPVYVDGYYDLWVEAYKTFKKIYIFDEEKIFSDFSNKKFKELIINDMNSVGVHVRRGDMANTGNYWKVLKPEI